MRALFALGALWTHSSVIDIYISTNPKVHKRSKVLQPKWHFKEPPLTEGPSYSQEHDRNNKTTPGIGNEGPLGTPPVTPPSPSQLPFS